MYKVNLNVSQDLNVDGIKSGSVVLRAEFGFQEQVDYAEKREVYERISCNEIVVPEFFRFYLVKMGCIGE